MQGIEDAKLGENASKTRQIKICFMITKGNWGGAQKYVYNLATSLPKDLYDVVVVVGEGGILKSKLETENIRVVEIPHLKRDISLIAEIRNFFKIVGIIFRERPDVLHLNSPKASGYGAVAGRICRVPKILQTVHGFTFNEERSDSAKISIFFFSWLTVLLTHKTIVIAEREKEQALTMPLISERKLALIRNGVEKIEFKEKDAARKELLSRINMSDIGDVTWIGTIAELHKNKGIDHVLYALARLHSPFLFFIIGEGEERNNLEELIKTHNLEGKVFLLGFMENPKEYLKAFDIFTLTSKKEGLPYTILEAGQASVAVIASSVGGIPDIIENGVSGILTSKTRSGEITRAIEYLISNPDKRELYGKNLKEKVEKDFSLQGMIEKTEELYK